MNAQRTGFETDMTGVHALANALSVSTSMNSIDMSNNGLTRGKYLGGGEYETNMTGIKAIAEALSVSSSSLTSLK